MRALVYSRPVLLSFAVALATISPAVAAPAADGMGPFEVVNLGDGVHLYRPSDPAPNRVNSLVVERDDGLLVVAAQPSPAAARELLAAIHARLEAPVAYLVLPHSHAEAAGGASAFPDRTLVIGSLGCRRALEDDAYAFGAEASLRAAASEAWSEPPRRLPILLLEAKTTLADGRNPVELFPLGPAHSPGDLLVILPGPDVFYMGALIFPDRRPFGNDARFNTWMSALNHFVRQAPRVMIPLHGANIGVAELREQRNALAWLRGQVENGLAERWSRDQIRDHILGLPDLEDRFAPASPFLPPLIERATEQARATRGKMIRD